MALYNEKVSYRKQIARQHSWSTVKILLISSLITMQNVAVVCVYARMQQVPKIWGSWVPGLLGSGGGGRD